MSQMTCAGMNPPVKRQRAGTADKTLKEAILALRQVTGPGLSKKDGRRLLELAREEFYRIEDEL